MPNMFGGDQFNADYLPCFHEDAAKIAAAKFATATPEAPLSAPADIPVAKLSPTPTEYEVFAAALRRVRPLSTVEYVDEAHDGACTRGLIIGTQYDTISFNFDGSGKLLAIRGSDDVRYNQAAVTPVLAALVSAQDATKASR